MNRLWGVIGFFTIHSSFVDLSDSYRLQFNTTAQQCELECMFDSRCYGYYYEFSNPRNSGCYLKGDPNNFIFYVQKLRPSILGIKVKNGERPWR
jgi:hypothetical protein